MSVAARLLARLRRRLTLARLDHQLERHRRSTLRELARRLGPYACRGEALSVTMRRCPPDERAEVLELLRRADAGPGGPDVDLVDAIYELVDSIAERRR